MNENSLSCPNHKVKLGLFVSKTGYTSKWRSDEEILEIVEFLGMKVETEIRKDEFCILHLTR